MTCPANLPAHVFGNAQSEPLTCRLDPGHDGDHIAPCRGTRWSVSDPALADVVLCVRLNRVERTARATEFDHQPVVGIPDQAALARCLAEIAGNAWHLTPEDARDQFLDQAGRVLDCFWPDRDDT